MHAVRSADTMPSHRVDERYAPPSLAQRRGPDRRRYYAGAIGQRRPSNGRVAHAAPTVAMDAARAPGDGRHRGLPGRVRRPPGRGRLAGPLHGRPGSSTPYRAGGACDTWAQSGVPSAPDALSTGRCRSACARRVGGRARVQKALALNRGESGRAVGSAWADTRHEPEQRSSTQPSLRKQAVVPQAAAPPKRRKQ